MNLWNPLRRPPSSVHPDPRYMAPTVEFPRILYESPNSHFLMPSPVEADPVTFMTTWQAGRSLYTQPGAVRRDVMAGRIQMQEVIR